ncbi:MAG TPA: hypothetical protein VNI84_16150 [Pyrinomonadaceae bacterium]|nr:hypothetical protein [Pyrinomonadaceae bacterium]
MSHSANSTVTNKSHLQQRIMASLTVQASWFDSESGETIVVNGMTENLGENSALVNLEILPPVGSDVQLRIFDEENTIIEVPTHVIRVQRDPSKMLASLSIIDNLKKWRQDALSAAQDWVTRHWQLNYEEEWVN